MWKVEDAPPLAETDKHPEVPSAGLNGKNSIAEFMLEHFGLPADAPLEEMEVLGGRFWSVDGGRLIFSDEPGVTVEQAKAICEMKPEKIAFVKAGEEVSAIIVKYLETHERVEL